MPHCQLVCLLSILFIGFIISSQSVLGRFALLFKRHNIMSLFSFIYKLKYGSYKESTRATLYEEIAASFNVTPQHVYELNHGKRVRSWVDGAIRDELKARFFRKEEEEMI